VTVVPFHRPEPADPHMTGEAKCLCCGDKWVAVAPVGTRFLERAKCGTFQGVWHNPVGAQEGDLQFYCASCGGEALTAFKRGGHFYLLCMGCGIDHTEAIFGA
jgi:hypothetical protein